MPNQDNSKITTMLKAPYVLGQALLNGVLLSFSVLKLLAKTSRENTQQVEENNTDGRLLYEEINNLFKDPVYQARWRKYIWRCLFIECFLLVVLCINIAYGSLIPSIQMTILLLGSVLFFSYRPWIIRNKRVVSFGYFLVKGLKKDMRALLLWESLEHK